MTKAEIAKRLLLGPYITYQAQWAAEAEAGMSSAIEDYWHKKIARELLDEHQRQCQNNSTS